MSIKSTQRVIKVGTSLAVTIPAKDAKKLGIVSGDFVDTTIKPVDKKPRISSEYDRFKKQYSQTLKNLANR